jgi:hypothetical protein
VENDGPNSSRGHDDDATANVVHFPRDWFGPRDELVPFGPGAEEGARDDAGTPTPLEPVTPPPVRADDFWGEDSASIHNAMQAPVTPDPFAKPEPVAAPDPVAEPEPVAVAGERSPSRAWRPSVGGLPARRRAVTWVGLGAAAITLVVVTLGSLRPQMIRAGGSGGAVPALTPAVIGDVPPAIASHPAGSGASHRRAGRGTGRVHASRARAHEIAGAASTTTSTQVASASRQTSATTQSSSAASQGSESASSTGASSDSGGGSARSQPAGPVGAGAPFGPGHLG